MSESEVNQTVFTDVAVFDGVNETLRKKVPMPISSWSMATRWRTSPRSPIATT